MKKLTLERQTRESRISVELQSEAPGISTGLPMLDHFLDQLSFYSGLSLRLEAQDLMPLGDGHHLAEDIAIVLGRALDQGLGDRKGVARYGQRMLPMDEALATVALDLGGRAWAVLAMDLPAPMLGALATENIPHFFRTLAMEGRFTLHLNVTGGNAHHMAEAAFKGFAMALREALAPVSDLRSTKGVLG